MDLSATRGPNGLWPQYRHPVTSGNDTRGLWLSVAAMTCLLAASLLSASNGFHTIANYIIAAVAGVILVSSGQQLWNHYRRRR